MPLFLQVISNNLLEVQKDSAFPEKNYFVLFAFCVLAAYYSNRFLGGLWDRVNRAEQKAEEAKKEVKEVKSIQTKEKSELETYIQFTEDSNAIPKDKNNNNSAIVHSENIKKGYLDKNHTMLAVASGTSYDDNLKYNIYYDPAIRSHGYNFKYIGLYKTGAIRGIGEVMKIVFCDYDEDKDILIPTKNEDVFRSLTKDEINRIKEIIKNTNYYDLTTGNKFFLVDKFYETEYKLDSPIVGKQYFWLNEFPKFSQNISAEGIANMLSELNATQSKTQTEG